MQDKDELQKKVCEQLKQLSQLRSQVSDLTLTTASHSVADEELPSAGVEELRLKVDELNSALEVRDKEVLHCNFVFMLAIKRFYSKNVKCSQNITFVLICIT